MRGFTLVEIMIVVVIIGLLAAMGLPTFRRVTMRSKASAVQNDLRTFSTAFITYNLQNGKWPLDEATGVIPTEMTGAIPPAFTIKTPIGGNYKWCYNSNPDGVTCKSAIIIEGSTANPLSDDTEMRQLIDQQLDDGDLFGGNIVVGSTNALVYILEK
jgi:prepilin-type N-terminal cleavage/methylation domain-containing protein